ncbi:MAG: M15 family metallopeptidase [Candidatus Saccharimonadales bacterium]
MDTSLTDISSRVPHLILDLKYATKNNVTGNIISDSKNAVLVPSVLDSLVKAAATLKKQGLCIVVWDAYRPASVQAVLRKYCDDDSFVARESNHSRGISIDLTLANIDNGKYLDMGTDFDVFDDRAHPDFPGLNAEQAKNRQILKTAMEAQKFQQLSTEWWHFDYAPLLNSKILEPEVEVAAK